MKMKSMVNTRDSTSYLRGMAIATVLINHYVNSYISVAYKHYASGMIALFFVLSGYGIFYSLSRYKGTKIQKFLTHLYNRCIRIYPLYWLSIVLFMIDEHRWYPLKTIFAIPIFRAPGSFWFIVVLIQCYLIAPLLFFALKKLNPVRYTSYVLSFMFLIYLIYPFTSLPYNNEVFIYRFMFLGHLFLFALGMVLPAVIERYGSKFDSTLLALISFALFLVALHYTRSKSMLFSHSAIFISPFFIIAAIVFCTVMISTNLRIPFNDPIVLMGKYSYSIFLFHDLFFDVLDKVGIIKYGNLTSVTITLLLMPIFILGCMKLEDIINQHLFKIRIN